MDNKEIMALIQAEFSEERITSRFDDEVMEWVDDDWEDEFDSEYDCYMERSNGEAESVVRNEMIDWFESKHSKLSLDQKCDINDCIMEEYNCLNR